MKVALAPEQQWPFRFPSLPGYQCDLAFDSTCHDGPPRSQVCTGSSLWRLPLDHSKWSHDYARACRLLGRPRTSCDCDGSVPANTEPGVRPRSTHAIVAGPCGCSGTRVVWLDGHDFFLDISSAYRAAQTMAREGEYRQC